MKPDTHLTRLDAKSIMQDFKFAWFTLLIVVVPSFIIVLITDRYPFLVTLLADSRASPWGVFTSIFVHFGFWHDFAPNATFMGVFTVCFVLTNVGIRSEIRMKRSKYFLAVSLISAVSANCLWIILVPTPSFGASGMIYASEGVTLAFALSNVMPHGKSLDEIKRHYFSQSGARLVVPSLIIFTFFFSLIIKNPSLFLSSGPHINVFVHAISFYAAFLATSAYHLLRERRTGTSTL